MKDIRPRYLNEYLTAKVTENCAGSALQRNNQNFETLANGWSRDFSRENQRERTVSNFGEPVAVATSRCYVSWSFIHSYRSFVATSRFSGDTVLLRGSRVSATWWMKLPFGLHRRVLITRDTVAGFDDILATRELIYCNAVGNKNRFVSERSTSPRINREYSTSFDVAEFLFV